MKLTDKEALRELKIVRCVELEESISEFPSNDRDGRSDMQILSDEVFYRLSLYDGGTCTSEDYEKAKEILRNTNHGKTMPLNKYTLRPMYSISAIEDAKNTVNEYKRLVSCMKRLHAKGY